MIRLQFKRLTYNVETWEGPVPVTGWALRPPPDLPWMRVCIRQVGRRWICDDYTTGYQIIGPWRSRERAEAARTNSRAAAARWIIAHARRMAFFQERK